MLSDAKTRDTAPSAILGRGVRDLIFTMHLDPIGNSIHSKVTMACQGMHTYRLVIQRSEPRGSVSLPVERLRNVSASGPLGNDTWKITTHSDP